MSRRRRSPGGSGPLDRLLAIDPNQAATAVVGCGAALAIGALLFGGFVPTAQVLVGVLYPLAVLFPVFGVAIAVYALRWLWFADRSGERPLVEGEPPETADTRTTRRVGRDLDWKLDAAAGGWYRCQGTGSAAAVRDVLVDAAATALTRTRGLDTEAAGAALRSGTWTDDPVAAAFLATDRRQPLGERLRGAIDPGAAYQRRVRRTIGAIEAIDSPAAIEAFDDGSAGAEPDGASPRGEPDDSIPRAEADAAEARTAPEVIR
ncbi:DUF7269 family protein [Halosolutus gelatinilyticus]|uniref:DUF7269 family protein n=1 Tax=Halosolutus gelatinilyticus TaxID=2931975 RepID=UPI001FF12E89|nr:hypothetical protein [Halosolutus gelatinilyticus]